VQVAADDTTYSEITLDVTLDERGSGFGTTGFGSTRF